MRAWILAWGVAAGLLVAGCGGDGADEGPPTKEEYISQGDEICALGTLRIGTEAQARFGSPQAKGTVSPKFSREVVVPTLRTEVLDRLRALEAPPGDRAAVRAITDALERSIDRLAAKPELLSAPDVGGAFDKANSLAQAYGFNQCGRN